MHLKMKTVHSLVMERLPDSDYSWGGKGGGEPVEYKKTGLNFKLYFLLQKILKQLLC